MGRPWRDAEPNKRVVTIRHKWMSFAKPPASLAVMNPRRRILDNPEAMAAVERIEWPAPGSVDSILS